MEKPKSTITRSEFGWTTVVADPKYHEKAEAQRKQAQEITQKRTAELLSQAGGQPIVRRSNFCGACFWIGNTGRVVFQGWLHRDWRPGFKASHLSYTY